jgi:CBS domain-containing protein
MTASPVATSSTVLAVDALVVMERNSKKSVTVLPVVDDEVVVGMLRMHDLVQAGLA